MAAAGCSFAQQPWQAPAQSASFRVYRPLASGLAQAGPAASSASFTARAHVLGQRFARYQSSQTLVPVSVSAFIVD